MIFICLVILLFESKNIRYIPTKERVHAREETGGMHKDNYTSNNIKL